MSLLFRLYRFCIQRFAFGAHDFHDFVQNARFAKSDEYGGGNQRVRRHVDTLVDKRVDERVTHCPIRETYPNGVFGKENHTRYKVGGKTQGEYGDTAQNDGQTTLFFALHFSKESHNADAHKGEQVIENQGERRKDKRVFHEVQKPVDKPHQKSVDRAVHVGVDKDRHERGYRNRTAVLNGTEFDNGKRKRHTYANACKGNPLGVTRFFIESGDDEDEGKQKYDCTDGNPFDDVRRPFADVQQGKKKHKITLLLRRFA